MGDLLWTTFNGLWSAYNAAGSGASIWSVTQARAAGRRSHYREGAGRSINAVAGISRASELIRVMQRRDRIDIHDVRRLAELLRLLALSESTGDGDREWLVASEAECLLRVEAGYALKASTGTSQYLVSLKVRLQALGIKIRLELVGDRP